LNKLNALAVGAERSADDKLQQAVRVATQYAPAPPAVRTLRCTSSP